MADPDPTRPVAAFQTVTWASSTFGRRPESGAAPIRTSRLRGDTGDWCAPSLREVVIWLVRPAGVLLLGGRPTSPAFFGTARGVPGRSWHRIARGPIRRCGWSCAVGARADGYGVWPVGDESHFRVSASLD